MISEKKINYYLHFAENSCNPECKKIIMQLVDEVKKLEHEANYLAGWIEWCPDDVPMGACDGTCSDNDEEFVPKEKCVQCWRERARKAVEKK